MTSRPREMHLNIGLNTTGYLESAWPYGSARMRDINDPDFYLKIARLAHRGRFDALFLSDHPALRTGAGTRPFHTIEPLILLTHLAAQVPDIGLVATLSTTYNSPFNLARSSQSVDVLTQGRLIVNMVSSFNPDVAANYGSEPLPPRKIRYDRAQEFLDLVKQLWQSWRPGGASRGPGDFWAGWQAEPVKFAGRHFTVDGPLNVPVSPQTHPVIAQAGGSDSGIEFAARHGEIIYANILSRQAGVAFRQKLAAKAREYGRDPAGIKLVPGVVPFVAETREAALRLHERLSGARNEDELVASFLRQFGLDPVRVDFDRVLRVEDVMPDPEQGGALGFLLGMVELLRHEPLTPRQAARRSAGHHRIVLGSPAEVADQLIQLWADGTVDGYTVQPPRSPEDTQIFVDQVVPILQERGVYRRFYRPNETIRDRYDLKLRSELRLEPS
ncbi:NtaA/DmoA family FMN-dependent monooxygenase [Paracoccus laeviglucosivorans]|uniref:FMN-dependent oxidoreductase, nitrilotriacetate monooxygenase family n=1 Tax=Paracoccus laeviglucosivorans TaxID=1197861 RepID=A0A521ESJ8_9RHOB|nr:NtaA/DmoA family FMN-dependent monooxygenase [Paracoccus laeviglucosivorans]SMO86928.1 FMN-dependent oxidoreductase, nitrilotriacetate monooxygenase family [Paracoccus laeviglucosivorans]